VELVVLVLVELEVVEVLVVVVDVVLVVVVVVDVELVVVVVVDVVLVLVLVVLLVVDVVVVAGPVNWKLCGVASIRSSPSIPAALPIATMFGGVPPTLTSRNTSPGPT
jgi:hypothetical protein